MTKFKDLNIEVVKGLDAYLITPAQLKNNFEQIASNPKTGVNARFTLNLSTLRYNVWQGERLAADYQSFEMAAPKFTYLIGKHQLDLHDPAPKCAEAIKKHFTAQRVAMLKESVSFHQSEANRLKEEIESLELELEPCEN